MGAWGYGILENDDALDAEVEIMEHFGCKQNKKDGKWDTKGLLSPSKVQKLYAGTNFSSIKILVLADLLIKLRQPIDFMITAIDGAIDDEMDASFEYDDPSPREKVLKRFKEDAAKYSLTGEVELARNKGLLEAVLEHVADGNPGLVNK